MNDLTANARPRSITFRSYIDADAPSLNMTVPAEPAAHADGAVAVAEATQTKARERTYFEVELTRIGKAELRNLWAVIPTTGKPGLEVTTDAHGELTLKAYFESPERAKPLVSTALQTIQNMNAQAVFDDFAKQSTGFIPQAPTQASAVQATPRSIKSEYFIDTRNTLDIAPEYEKPVHVNAADISYHESAIATERAKRSFIKVELQGVNKRDLVPLLPSLPLPENGKWAGFTLSSTPDGRFNITNYCNSSSSATKLVTATLNTLKPSNGQEVRAELRQASETYLRSSGQSI